MKMNASLAYITYFPMRPTVMTVVSLTRLSELLRSGLTLWNNPSTSFVLSSSRSTNCIKSMRARLSKRPT